MKLISLPFPVGILLTIGGVWVIGFAVYTCVQPFVQADPAGSTTEVRDSQLADHIFRVSGTLLALILSLTFASLRNDHAALRDAIKLEAAQVQDIYFDLAHFGSDAANELSSLVLEYTHLVINSEWNSLANGELDSETIDAFEKLQFGIHKLDAKTYVQKSLRSNLIQDVDEISDHRQHRAFQAVPDPPHFIYVALVGFLISMAALSSYHLTRLTIRMISLYCSFIGLVIYFMLAMSSPFYGVMKLSPQPLERIVIQIQNSNTAVTR